MARFFPESLSMAMLAARERCLLSALDRVLARRRWSRPEIEDFQVCSLKEVVAHAFATVPLYRDKYRAAGFDPSALHRLNDLRTIPLLTKEELRDAALHSLRSADAAATARLLSTSGSTGMPIRIYRDADSLWHFTAHSMALYYDWCAQRPLENALYFLDLTPDSIDCALADQLRTMVAEQRLQSIHEPSEVLASRIMELRPQFISTYPSTMRNIAIWMHRRGRSYEGLRLVHHTSEMLDQRTRRLLGCVFPRARLVETYSSTEAGLMAYSCAQTNRWHLAEDSAIYEILDRHGNPTEGVGEMVVTDLINRTTPIIRYRGLGDYCRWGETSCPCGTMFRSIEHLEGRRTESIILPDGRSLSPYLLTNALEEVGGIYQYQIIQRTPVEFEVLVVKDARAPTIESVLQQAIEHALLRLLPAETRCLVRQVETIPPGAGRHKVPLVISHVQGTS